MENFGRKDKAVRGDGGELGIGEASCDAEREEKEVDDVGHADGDDMDELRTSAQHWSPCR